MTLQDPAIQIAIAALLLAFGAPPLAVLAYLICVVLTKDNGSGRP
jgi:hypothetical protein